MLKIILTPSKLIFKNIPDDILFSITKKYKFYEFKVSENKKDVYTSNTPEKLFLLLCELSYTYDIELI